jgi:hypothetical protein
MSRENVDAVRRTYEKFAATHEPLWEILTDDAIMDARDASPDFLGISSRDEATTAFREYVDTFERYDVELEEIIHADDTRVVTAVRDGGRIRGSDADTANLGE